jgi:hypothetical protein
MSSAQAQNGYYYWDSFRFNFNYFNSIEDFFQKGEEAMARNKSKTSGKAKRDYDDDIGKDDVESWKNQSDYEYKNRLNELLEEMETEFAQIDMGGTFKKSRLKITSDERGVFSFGLASQGLFKPQEYFSQELADDNPNEFPNKPSGVVPAKEIEFIKILGKMQYWYQSPKTDKRYLCERQQEGTRDVALGLRKNPKYRTKTKKSYVMFEKKGGKAKMVELFVPLHGSIYLGNVMPLYLVVKFLRQMNIMVRINSIRMYHEKGDYFFGWCVPIKDFGEDIDYNQIAKASVDGQWWRVMRANLRAITDDKDWNGVMRTDGSGSEAGDRWDYNNVFSRFKNWYLEQIKLGELPPLRVDKRLLLFGGAFSSTTKEGIMKEVYRILDLVDFQFNDINACLKRIYKREVDVKLEKYFEEQVTYNWGYAKSVKVSQQDIDRKMSIEKADLTKKFNDYVIEIFTDTYTYPSRGEYATPSEEADKIEEEFDDKLLKLRNFLKNV